MNRTLTGLLAAVLVIGVAAWLSTREESRSAPSALSLAGFATTEQIEAEKNRGMLDPREEIPSPVDEILIERSGDTIHLKRSGAGKESTWALLEPVAAKATRFQANKMVKAVKMARVTPMNHLNQWIIEGILNLKWFNCLLSCRVIKVRKAKAKPYLKNR